MIRVYSYRTVAGNGGGGEGREAVRLYRLLRRNVSARFVVRSIQHCCPRELMYAIHWLVDGQHTRGRFYPVFEIFIVSPVCSTSTPRQRHLSVSWMKIVGANGTALATGARARGLNGSLMVPALSLSLSTPLPPSLPLSVSGNSVYCSPPTPPPRPPSAQPLPQNTGSPLRWPSVPRSPALRVARRKNKAEEAGRHRYTIQIQHELGGKQHVSTEQLHSSLRTQRQHPRQEQERTNKHAHPSLRQQQQQQRQQPAPGQPKPS